MRGVGNVLAFGLAEMMRLRRPNMRGKLILVGTFLAIAAFAGGYGAAIAGLTITQGAAESGAGNYEPTNAISGWSQSTSGVSSTPASAPSVLSSTAGSPTVLASSGQSYGINAQTSGDISQYFGFQEASGVGANEEIELTFTITGSGGTITGNPATVFVETQSTLPTLPQTYTLDYDLGTPSSGTVSISSAQQVSLQCAAVGSCP